MSAHKREQAGLGTRDIDDLVNARHGDPFAVLGPHELGAGTWTGPARSAISPPATGLGPADPG